MGCTISKSLQTDDHNLETFSIFWLDAQVNTTEDNRRTQQTLREIINHLKTFDDQHECHQRILSLSPQDRLILIVSGRCGRQLVPQIHHLRQLSSIYVYCMNKQDNDQWAKDFTKVKSVIIRLDDLTNAIKADQKSRAKVEDPISINIFSVQNNADKSTTELNGHFVHSLLLIDVLIRMKSIESDKQELIQLCNKEYQHNSTQLALVREFEQQYTAHRALWWYTRDSFLYRMLNKALRVQNIDLLFSLRFVIGDMSRQLKEYQCQSPVHVYRGQVMSNEELNTLRQSVGNLISINSFFSTSANRLKALGFLNSSAISTDLVRILFVIDANPNVVKSKPFADISTLSKFGNECEILFMIGCIFRLVKIEPMSDERIWMVHMELCSDDEHELRKLFDHMKKDYGGGGDAEVNLRSFGDVLREMGKYDLAEKMYHRLLRELPNNDPSLSDLYWVLGTLNQNKANYDSSLQWFRKSLEIYQNKNSSDHVSIGNLNNSIGAVYNDKGDLIRALEYYNKGIELFRNANDENHPDLAHIYNNIGIVYYDQKKYTEALDFHQKSLIIMEHHLPPDHPDVAASHNNIGNAYGYCGQYDLAIEHHEQALKIRLKSLPSDHPHVATSYENIGVVHESKGQWKQALELYEKAATIYSHSLPAQHPHVIRIKKSIQRVSSNLN